MKILNIKINQRGQLLVELILVMGLVALLMPAMLTAFFSSREGKVQQESRQTATALLKETEVAMKAIKNNNWTTITGATVGSPYHPAISGANWTLAAGSDTVNGFTRQVVIQNVSRDNNGAIVTSGGTTDPSTKQVVITISWTQPSSSSLTSTLLLTRTDNITYTETTQAQFTSGTETGTSVVETVGSSISGDGQIQLSTGGGNGNWCAPEIDATNLDLPKNGVANGISATLGNAYVGTGDNASGESFVKVNVNSSVDPPVPSLGATFDGYKTNGVFGETNYAYLSTDTNTKHVVIMDLNQVVGGKYTEVGYFDANTSTDATGVFVSGSVGYVIIGNTLRTFNLSSKSGSRAQLGSVNLAGAGNKIIVSGNYAYVTTSAGNAELQIIEIANGGATLTVRGNVNVNGGAGRDVFVNTTATRAYLATAASATQREMHVIDITTKTAPVVVGSGYEANGMSPNGVTLVPGNIAILVGSGGEQYQVINIANESTPVRCGGLNVGATVNGIQSVLDAQNNAYSYIIVATNPEFRIVQGGDGGTFATSGTYESATYDPFSVDGGSYSRSFNRFLAAVNQPSNTSLKMQVAIQEPINGSCSGVNYSYVGPNGTTNSTDTYNVIGGQIQGVIPLVNLTPTLNYANPGRCTRYKLYFDTGEVTQTPVFYDIIWNYSP